jgi:hypothetical protein
MARRTITEIQRAVVVDERGGVLTYARDRCKSVDAMVARGSMDEEAGRLIKTTIRQFSGAVAIGLHIEGEDLPGVREAMRPIVKAAADV